MECDSCGRYRPSSEIVPIRDLEGHLLMACGACRRLFAAAARETATDRGVAPLTPRSVPVITTTTSPAPVVRPV
jgi:hypothetical protein